MHWQRSVAPSAPKNELAFANHANNRIVHLPDDRPVVDEKAIGDPRQALDSLALVDANRLVGQVAAGRHDRDNRDLAAASDAAGCKEA